MLRKRVIPCLLVRKKGLVKTVNFASEKYVGDPLNAVRIFNEKKVDELIVLDIDASTEGREPDYTLIENIASECRMPLCYGGGVKSIDQIEKIVRLGAEKVAISSGLVENPALLAQAAARVGRQSLVAVLDVKKSNLLRKYEQYICNGTKKIGKNISEIVSRFEKEGAGEILVNSIDKDGTMSGYDLDLLKRVRASTTLPITALGGAGALHDFADAFEKCGVNGGAAGSFFVFKGKYRAVLISYPTYDEMEACFKR